MYFIYLYFILFVELLYKCTSIWRKLMSLIAKKVIAQNLPYFHQNSLKIFLNLTDCWKKIWQLCMAKVKVFKSRFNFKVKVTNYCNMWKVM